MGKTFVKRTPEEKREQIKEITDKLDAELKSFVDSDKFKNYLKTMSKFHNYSFNNTILIAMQKPDASMVAGFRAWETNFNRHVKKGEKGIRILAPAPYKKTIEQDALDPDTKKPIYDADGNVKKEAVQITVPSYKVATVFDVSSTEGEPLPQIGVDELTGKVEGYKELIEAIKKVAPVPVEMALIESGAKGYFSPSEQKIVINEGMSELQTLKTLIHETAHSLLHDKDGSKIEGLEDTEKKTRNSKEVEAESVAYTCVSYLSDTYGLDIDTSDYSFGYIAGWVSTLELVELKESMETIRKTASHIITGIEDRLKEVELEKLATELDEMAYDWDTYGYKDAVDDREVNVNVILKDLQRGDIESERLFLTELIAEEENPEIISKANELLKKVDALSSKKESKVEKAVSTIKDKLSEGKLKSAAKAALEPVIDKPKEHVLA